MNRTLAGVFAGALVVLCANATAQVEKIVFGLVTQPSLTYAPHYMAKGAGYFKEEGLDVEIISFDGTATLVPQLSTKRVMVGWATPDVIILSNQPDKDRLPLRFFYNGSRIAPWEMVVPEASAVKKLADLKGKRIGVGSLNFGNIPVTKAMFKELGMESGRDYELQPVGAGGAAFIAFNNGQVDALNLFDAAHATLELTGAKIRRVPIPDKFTKVTAHGLVTHEETLKSQPKLLAGFGRAFAKGMVACDAAPKQCVENFWTMYPNLKPTAGSDEKKLSDAIDVMRYGLRKYQAFDSDRRWGNYDEKGLRNAVDALHVGGQIQNSSLDVKTLYTNSLIDEINRFDAQAVSVAARKLP